MIDFKYCPQCRRKLKPDSYDGSPSCSFCQRSYYNNSSPCACILAVKDGKVLVARRAIEPYKGAYDTVGGFLKYGEDSRKGALREAKEETGLDVEITDLLGIYPDQYGPGGDHTINIVYIGKVKGGKMQPQDDVAALEWVEIDKLPIPSGGFKSTDLAFADLKKWFSSHDKQS